MPTENVGNPNTDILDRELEALLNSDPTSEYLEDIDALTRDLQELLVSLWPTAQDRARAYLEGIRSNVEKLRSLK